MKRKGEKSKMEKMKPEEFKALTLDMMDHFAQFCEENKLRYVIDYGTLLGAVRHKGFIPWDDDIDVTMPREDYDRLFELTKNHTNVIGGILL